MTTEPLVKGQTMTMKYQVVKSTFFDIIHAEEAGVTVMWDRGTRIRVHIHPKFKGIIIEVH